MKILYIAEVVGKAGIFCLKKTLGTLKSELKADAVIVCADGATNSSGLGRQHAGYIKKLGADVITLGDLCFYKKDLAENMHEIPRVLRPANLSPAAAGKGTAVITIQAPSPYAGKRLGVGVLLGQARFDKLHADNPFSALSGLTEQLRAESDAVILDFHAAASAEKKTLFAMADGLCSAVIGSHDRVAASDEEILPNGTAVITDAGRTGSFLSVGGCDAHERIREYLSGIPNWTKEAWDGLETQGVLIDIADDGRARSIVRIRKTVKSPHAQFANDLHQ
ncbi:MAG: YmdB family metallophosphoesterase [Spirochaetaceae bacterium]|jgi:metallophosphoesterase (TIGR00282 family)|nr:YmdB family metallophosphoesterase [Spirochaetaceae bacterium]